MLKAGRGLFFFVGVVGLILSILSFWLNTTKIGFVLCTIALIGHMATWAIMSKAKELDRSLPH